ncbi:MAG TPA: thiamine-phosphate kinase [Bauldia sp.]|nr:thiamine-phosphate kinase [Bauldia sp.]
MAARPGEFELIEKYFRPLATDAGALGLSDDAAWFRPAAGEEIVLTTDLIAAGVHFFPGDPPESIARKALRVNLSDLAGKGARPLGYLVALALPEDWTEAWIRRFARALADDQRRYAISLFGGDTSRASGGLTIAVTAFGTLPRGTMVHRDGARPGDLVYVSGTIGDAALGLLVCLGRVAGSVPAAARKALIDRYRHPQPRVELAVAIRRYATAAMDVSDGLVGDLGHICRTSGVTAEIDAGSVPLARAARQVVALGPDYLVAAITGGDDYEILATVSPQNGPAFERAAAKAGVAVTRIGRIVAGKGPPKVRDAGGEALRFDRAGHTHF